LTASGVKEYVTQTDGSQRGGGWGEGEGLGGAADAVAVGVAELVCGCATAKTHKESTPPTIAIIEPAGPVLGYRHADSSQREEWGRTPVGCDYGVPVTDESSFK
jgi:hypothetical protein